MVDAELYYFGHNLDSKTRDTRIRFDGFFLLMYSGVQDLEGLSRYEQLVFVSTILFCGSRHFVNRCYIQALHLLIQRVDIDILLPLAGLVGHSASRLDVALKFISAWCSSATSFGTLVSVRLMTSLLTSRVHYNWSSLHLAV